MRHFTVVTFRCCDREIETEGQYFARGTSVPGDPVYCPWCKTPTGERAYYKHITEP